MTDRLDRLERHLSEVLAGPRRLMRSLSKTAIGTYAMTAQNETVAAVLADLKILVDSDALESVYARLESALTKAEAVEPLAVVCLTDEPYSHGHMVEAQLQIMPGTELPIGMKLYAHAPPAVPVESLGRDAEPAGGLDAAMRTNGLPAVSDALGYSRNFAAANPHLTQTTKDHITGLCDMLELASAHQTTPPTPPPASVPDVLRRLYAAAEKGFHVSRTCGPDKKYHYVSEFRNIDDLHAYQSAWTAAMVSVRDAEASR